MRHHAFILGRVLERRNKWEAAIKAYSSIGALDTLEPDVLYRLGHAHFRANNNEEAVRYIRTAIAKNPAIAQWHYRLGFVLERLKRYEEAAASYKSALALSPAEVTWQERLEKCYAQLRTLRHGLLADAYKKSGQLQRQALIHSAIDVLEGQLSMSPLDAGLLKRLAEAYERVQEYSDAAEYYARAVKVSDDPNLAFSAGYSYFRNRQVDKADEYYGLALRRQGGEAQRLGTGLFFEKRGLWRQAAEHYSKKADAAPGDSELQFRLGMAYDRLYEWDDAQTHYQRAIELGPTRPYRYYRLGFVRERAGKFEGALDAYTVAAAYKGKESAFWKFRRAYCLTQIGRAEEACKAYISSETTLLNRYALQDSYGVGGSGSSLLEHSLRSARADNRRSESEQIGELALASGDYELAATAFQMNIDSSADHAKENFFRLGYALHLAGDHAAGANAFAAMRLHNESHGINTASYDKDAGLSEVISYTELMKQTAIREDVVLYESGHGDSVSCNPYAIFQELSRTNNRDIWHVWVCNDPAKAPEDVKSHKRVVLVEKGTYLYRRYLASAKFLINNTSFPPYFIRRDEQKYLNTWHGTPLKTLGKDVKTGFFEHRNVARNLLHATHLLAPNSHTERVLLESHEIDGLYSGKVALTGYPRIDKTLTASAEDVKNLRQRLGIAPGDHRPVVLYAPTWRGGLGSSYFDTAQLKSDLEAIQSQGRHIFFRAHRFAEEIIQKSSLPAKVVPADIDTNELLAAVDVLVTDYSSIFFDFLPLGRPILFYVPDLDNYESERGLYFKMEDMPGVICKDSTSLALQLKQAVSTLGRRANQNSKLEFCPMEDGHATQRTIDFFFNDSDTYLMPSRSDDRETIIFRQSLIPNGITSSFISLVNGMDFNKYRAVLLFDANSIHNSPERLRLFESLPSQVQRIARSGRQLFTVEEKWLDGKFSAQGQVSNQEQMQIIAETASREFARIFGRQTKSDFLCEFDGYSRFWAGIFAHGGAEVRQRLIYMHNELAPEHRMKHPSLNGVFSLYRYFDRLISVSQSVMEANRAALAETYEVPADKFVYANNMINPDAIRSASRDIVSPFIVEWLSSESKTIVSMGRLSPEKGHERLIRAFARTLSEALDTQLVIVGEGGLRPVLEGLIDELGLAERVLLAGALDNPFPVLALADGFILPSVHEGQGLALLEAMVLGKPVVATNIAGPRSLIGDYGGLLVSNDDQGVYEGLVALANGAASTAEFDPLGYQQAAMSAFISNLDNS